MLIILTVGLVGCEKEETIETETSDFTLERAQSSRTFSARFYIDGTYEVNNSEMLESNELLEQFELGALNVAQLLRESSQEQDILMLSIDKNGNLISSVEELIPSIYVKDYMDGDIDATSFFHWNYDEFRDCVGYWWFAPGANIVACAIGCAIACSDS